MFVVNTEMQIERIILFISKVFCRYLYFHMDRIWFYLSRLYLSLFFCLHTNTMEINENENSNLLVTDCVTGYLILSSDTKTDLSLDCKFHAGVWFVTPCMNVDSASRKS